MASPTFDPLATTVDATEARHDVQSVPARRITRAFHKVPFWEPLVIFIVTFAALAAFTPRVISYLTPTTGDEPFYMMTIISLLKDGDLNECNNYIQRDELDLYPSFYGFREDGVAYVRFPSGWPGWRGSPLPLPPHPAVISPESRNCSSNYKVYPIEYDNPDGELYSKHGVGLSLLLLPAYSIGGRLLIVFFLNLLGAILAANVYLLARESAGRIGVAVMTWVAFAFTVPQMPYSYLIFTEMPAALLTLYAFRRIRIWQNNLLQTIGIGVCTAFLPWLHYRFAPICVGLAIYYIYQLRKHKCEPGGTRIRDSIVLAGITGISAALLMLLFYTRYGVPWPNGSDHAGISDAAGTLRGAVGLFLDQQWGLFVAAPIFIIALVGVILMAINVAQRRDLIWIAVISLPYFLIIANYAQWWGEWCPPARYLASILPLFALPFAHALESIHGMAFRGIYALLLIPSFMTMWGFLYQPQWMYNQPVLEGALNGKSELLMKGFGALGRAMGIPAVRRIDLTEFFPSFVQPYFAYMQGEPYGDAASNDAWRTSLLPAAIISFIIFLSFLLLWWSNRAPGGSDVDIDPSTDAPSEYEPTRTVESDAHPTGALPAQQAITVAPTGTSDSVPINWLPGILRRTSSTSSLTWSKE